MNNFVHLLESMQWFSFPLSKLPQELTRAYNSTIGITFACAIVIFVKLRNNLEGHILTLSGKLQTHHVIIVNLLDSQATQLLMALSHLAKLNDREDDDNDNDDKGGSK